MRWKLNIKGTKLSVHSQTREVTLHYQKEEMSNDSHPILKAMYDFLPHVHWDCKGGNHDHNRTCPKPDRGCTIKI